MLIGGSLLGADSLLAKNIQWENFDEDYGKGIGLFNKTQVKLLNEIAETILPATASVPGAKAAKVGQFIAVIVSDCYEPEDQKRFMTGLAKVDAEAKSRYGKTYLKLGQGMRHDLLTELDVQQKAAKKAGGEAHYFRKIKDLVLWGYFTSEIGSTQALRFVEYPGRNETIAYKKGDRAFSG